MIRRLLDIPDAEKRWSWYPGTTGGLKCLGILGNMLAPVTSALE